jgi:cell division septal protein FtsQ
VKIKRLFFLVVFAGLAATGGVIFWNSSALKLKRVEVAGNRHIAKEELASATGLSAGAPLLEIKTNQVARRLETLPWVMDAKVERVIPSKLRITVVERTPIASVAAGGKSYLVDREGVVLKEGGGLELSIGGLPLKALTVGQRVSLRQFKEVLTVLDGLEKSLRPKVKSVEATSVDRITLKLSDGTSVLFGAAEKIDQKNYALTAIFAESVKEGTRLVSVDVRVPDRPAVRQR